VRIVEEVGGRPAYMKPKMAVTVITLNATAKETYNGAIW
jgi:hypothetical protein